jgi:hypothetical protein
MDVGIFHDLKTVVVNEIVKKCVGVGQKGE